MVEMADDSCAWQQMVEMADDSCERQQMVEMTNRSCCCCQRVITWKIARQ